MDALQAYYKDKLGTEVEGLRIEIEYDEGYRYSSWTYEDPSFKVRVSHLDSHGGLLYESNGTAAEFLSELFAWEDSQ